MTKKINRQTALRALVGVGVTLPVLGQERSKKELKEFQEEVGVAWRRSLDYSLTIIGQMPEEHLDFHYTPEAMTFRGQFVHCIVFTAMQFAGRFDIPNPYDTKNDWQKLSKAQLIEEMKGFYAWVEKVVGELPAERLARHEGYAGGKIQAWRFFYAMENHIIHHRGQAICYLRLKGVTPEGYVGW